jgi:hypothetical protein
MKKKIGVLSLLAILVISIASVPPCTATSTSDSFTFKKNEFDPYLYLCDDIEVTSGMDVTVRVSDNWRFWPGLTSDTLTISITPGTTTLMVEALGYDGSTYYYKYQSEEETFTTPLGQSGKHKLLEESASGYYEGWKIKTSVRMDGKLVTLIDYSGAVLDVTPNYYSIDSTDDETSTVTTSVSFLGQGSISVAFTYYARFKMYVEETYDGSTYWDTDSDWSDWFSIGSGTLVINMTNMGVALFGVVLGAIIAIVVVGVVLTKRRKSMPKTEIKPPEAEIESPPPEVDTDIQCPNCGAYIPAESAHCPYCGDIL